MSDWVQARNEEKSRISKLSPKDRLDYVDGCIRCVNAIGFSSWGWLQWLSNPSLISWFDEPTLKGFFEKLKEFALALIEFDIEATRKGMKPELQMQKPYV
jgi:hypothetical protein